VEISNPKSISGIDKKGDFGEINALLKTFYETNIRGKGEVPDNRTGPKFEEYMTALKMTNNLKHSFMLDRFVDLDPTADSIADLGKSFFKKYIQKEFNPNYDPLAPDTDETPRRPTSLDSIKTVEHVRNVSLKEGGEVLSPRKTIGSGGGVGILYSLGKPGSGKAGKFFYDLGISQEKSLADAYSNEVKFEILANHRAKGLEHVLQSDGAFKSEKDLKIVLIMDYYETNGKNNGTELGAYLTEKPPNENPPLNEKQLKLVMHDVKAGLMELADNGIIYRDLKLENIMLVFADDGKTIVGAKLFDLGTCYHLPSMDFLAGEGDEPFESDLGTAGYFNNNEQMEDIEKFLTFPVVTLFLNLLTGVTGANFTKNAYLASSANIDIAKGIIDENYKSENPDIMDNQKENIRTTTKKIREDLESRGMLQFAEDLLKNHVMPGLNGDQSKRPGLRDLPDFSKI